MLSAELGKYDVSASAYDALGRESLTTNLGKFNAKKWCALRVRARGE